MFRGLRKVQELLNASTRATLMTPRFLVKKKNPVKEEFCSWEWLTKTVTIKITFEKCDSAPSPVTLWHRKHDDSYRNEPIFFKSFIQSQTLALKVGNLLKYQGLQKRKSCYSKGSVLINLIGITRNSVTLFYLKCVPWKKTNKLKKMTYWWLSFSIISQ